MLRSWNKVTCFSGIFLTLLSYAASADTKLFPIDHYNQEVSHWIPENTANYDKSLLTPEIQQNYIDTLYKHYYSSLSPWSSDYVDAILNHNDAEDILAAENKLLNDLSANHGYDENHIPYNTDWLVRLKNNANLEQFQSANYQANNRAIAVDNIEARRLPTGDAYFYTTHTAEDTYDRLQFADIWAGTPLYILGDSLDHAWTCVLTPDFIAWVKTNSIARVNPSFIRIWQAAAKNHLVAITRTDTAIIDNTNKFRFTAYIGSVFPGEETKNGINILIPIADENRNAITGSALVTHNDAEMMPVSITPHHLAQLMQSLIGRRNTYGGLSFYNDSFSELNNLFIPFGISLSQSALSAKQIDLSQTSPEQRIAYLKENGLAFLTIVSADQQKFLYIGNTANTDNGSVVMTYQNCNGFNTQDKQISVLGRSVFLPLLLNYPEDEQIISQAKLNSFLVSRIDMLNKTPIKPKVQTLIER